MKKTSWILIVLLAALPLTAGEGGHCDEKSKKSEHQAKAEGGQHKGHAGGKSCDMKAGEGTPVEMDGTLLCRSCDLHQTETCEKVFQTAGESSKLVPICKGSKVDLEALSEHGGAKLHVKGKMVKCAEDGHDELLIEEATKI